MLFNITSNAIIFLSDREVDPNIALGDTFLTSNAKVRAYWNFTKLSGSDDDVLTSHPDSRGNGWTLDNASGVNDPRLGFIQSSLNTCSALKANTASGVKKAFKTTTVATDLLKNDVEVHVLMVLSDGINGGTNIIFGSSDGGTRFFRLRVDASGNIQLEYAANASGLSTLTSSGYTIPDGLTGVMLLRLRCDFTTDVISGMINGIPITFSLGSGNAISSWNAANWFSSKGCGVGGSYDGVFTSDVSISNKFILKTSVTDLLTDDEYLILASSFLNYI